MKAKKLEAYLSMAGSVLGAGALQGQVTYTDFNPDVVLDLNNSPVSFMLDIDQDGVNDIEIEGSHVSSMTANSYTFTTSWTTYFSGYTYTYAYTYTYWSYNRQISRIWEANGLSFQKRLAEASNYYGYNYYGSHQAFDAGDPIGGSWQAGFQMSGDLYDYGFYQFSSNYFWTSWAYTYGMWNVGQSKFLGVEMEKNGQMHYGWVRITRNSLDELTIHDMAISDVPSVPILAGDTTVANPAGLDDRRNALLRLSKGPERLIIKSMPLISDFTVLIANTAGQTVWSGEGKPGEKIEIALTDWRRGTYVVFIKTERGKMLRRKIVH